MFRNPHYITKGISLTLPPETIIMLWQMVAEMPEPKDYLQIFRLTAEENLQRIEHEQEQPPYKQNGCFPCSKPVKEKVYIIDDEDHSTMLLAEEY